MQDSLGPQLTGHARTPCCAKLRHWYPESSISTHIKSGPQGLPCRSLHFLNLSEDACESDVLLVGADAVSVAAESRRRLLGVFSDCIFEFAAKKLLPKDGDNGRPPPSNACIRARQQVPTTRLRTVCILLTVSIGFVRTTTYYGPLVHALDIVERQDYNNTYSNI
jgi:hypothetical protein